MSALSEEPQNRPVPFRRDGASGLPRTLDDAKHSASSLIVVRRVPEALLVDLTTCQGDRTTITGREHLSDARWIPNQAHQEGEILDVTIRMLESQRCLGLADDRCRKARPGNRDGPPAGCFSGGLTLVNPRDERLDAAGSDLVDVRLSPCQDLAVIETAAPQEVPRCVGEKMGSLDLSELGAGLLDTVVAWEMRDRTTLDGTPPMPVFSSYATPPRPV